MTDDAGRAQRKQVELLQGRLKEAHEDLAVPHTEGYVQSLQELSDEARELERVGAAKDAEHRLTLQTLARYRNDIAEAERALLAPKAVSNVSPALGAIALGAVAASATAMAYFLSTGQSPLALAFLGAATVLPGPVCAWVWKRQLSAGRGKSFSKQ